MWGSLGRVAVMKFIGSMSASADVLALASVEVSLDAIPEVFELDCVLSFSDLFRALQLPLNGAENPFLFVIEQQMTFLVRKLMIVWIYEILRRMRIELKDQNGANHLINILPFLICSG
jgi:hypothetical protein